MALPTLSFGFWSRVIVLAEEDTARSLFYTNLKIFLLLLLSFLTGAHLDIGLTKKVLVSVLEYFLHSVERLTPITNVIVSRTVDMLP